MKIIKNLICKIKGHDQIKKAEHNVTLSVGRNQYGQLGRNALPVDFVKPHIYEGCEIETTTCKRCGTFIRKTEKLGTPAPECFKI